MKSYDYSKSSIYITYWLDTNGNSILNWFLHTEYHFINTKNNYIQTLRNMTSDAQQSKRLFNKQDKIFDV